MRSAVTPTRRSPAMTGALAERRTVHFEGRRVSDAGVYDDAFAPLRLERKPFAHVDVSLS